MTTRKIRHIGWSHTNRDRVREVLKVLLRLIPALVFMEILLTAKHPAPFHLHPIAWMVFIIPAVLLTWITYR